ncbi:hypothetical protein [Paenibacillus whitsoniae]|nr:hypothetical protein [Paenibacillus whitsoniae]
MMTKKPWSTQELDKLLRLATECPPVVIARELSRPVTSVRKKMREMGISYVSGEQWKKNQFQFLIADDGNDYKHICAREPKENDWDSPVLDEFWTTLVKMARVAKSRGKRVDVLSFIDTYRKIRIGG